jgi:acyl-homoserine lactone acylase PvdQ
VDITAQGPVISQAGQVMAVDWMGNAPSGDVGALLGAWLARAVTPRKAGRPAVTEESQT